MGYKIRIELFKELEMSLLDFESSSAVHILNSFDQINWIQQATWGFMEENHGTFPYFEIQHIHSERKIGGLFVTYTPNDYNFICHAEIYQKQPKSHLFGLFKSEVMPSFDNEQTPFDVFRHSLERFLQGNDAEVERLLNIEYPQLGGRR
ncbi:MULTISPECIES: hypothetical protein [Acinetobacter]|uniref:Uncharacterized protein n=1 Tax=Acinetobacter wuhouensis TaxID=1879050 RepID=A0A3G2T5B6_9GAMM|nr:MULTISPECIES: hypothetical protein [Acinetobacter]AYO55483.1 hypothetical protein CDG68_18285 [Acinetobacter wuhouensis]RZG72895.1 hypothetical protein EXE09_16060 [Acinetobacter sp. WCHAc060025]